MRSFEHLRNFLLFLLLALGCACSPQRPAGVPWGMVDFVQTYNAYSLAQLYRDRGEHAQAVVEYEQSLKRYALLDDHARTLLRDEYGISQERIEQELAAARALARPHPATDE
jgi:hypothetical protein